MIWYVWMEGLYLNCTEGETATTVFRVALSLQSLGCRCFKPVTAGGKHCYWSVPDCPGHAKYIHHGIQGNLTNDSSHGYCTWLNLSYRSHFSLQYFGYVNLCLFFPCFNDSLQTQLCSDHGHSPLMKKVFEVHLCFLRINQSETALKQVFTSLRTFIYKVWGTCSCLCVVRYVLKCAPKLMSCLFSLPSSFPARFSKGVLTCVPLSATKSWSVVTPSWAPSAATQPTSSTSSWRATLTTRGASHSSGHTCRSVRAAFQRIWDPTWCFFFFNAAQLLPTLK